MSTRPPIVTTPGVMAPGAVRWAEPIGMRAANRRMADDRVGEYHLTDGQVVWVEWEPESQTNTRIQIWGGGHILYQAAGVVRPHAARLSEAKLRNLEGSAP